MGSEPPQEEDPIAKKLQEAAARDREATDAAAGESLLTADFATFARDRGPSELRKIEELALARVSRINAQAPPAQFRYDQSARSIEAGIYSANFGSQFQVRLAVGLASDAAQRMAPVPVWNLELRTIGPLRIRMVFSGGTRPRVGGASQRKSRATRSKRFRIS
jgi:hypothetical protein